MESVSVISWCTCTLRAALCFSASAFQSSLPCKFLPHILTVRVCCIRSRSRSKPCLWYADAGIDYSRHHTPRHPLFLTIITAVCASINLLRCRAQSQCVTGRRSKLTMNMGMCWIRLPSNPSLCPYLTPSTRGRHSPNDATTSSSGSSIPTMPNCACIGLLSLKQPIHSVVL
jgi:hypothetical protein